MRRILMAGAMALMAVPVFAAEVRRDILSEQPLTGADDMVVIVSRLTVEPGATIPLHTHPGDEHGVVLTEATMKTPSGAEVTFKEGDVVFFPAGEVHGGLTNAGDSDAVVLTTHVVLVTEPFETPAN